MIKIIQKKDLEKASKNSGWPFKMNQVILLKGYEVIGYV